MALILHIETATTVCSVSLARSGEHLCTLQTDEPFRHAEKLHTYIHEALAEIGAQPKDLAAIAVSRGPGSYTGLRIGVSTAKGMAYALGIPLIGIDTLQSMAAGLIPNTDPEGETYYCPMLDARRMEVYCALYREDLSLVSPTQALILTEESVKQFPSHRVIYFFGDGMPKGRELLEANPNAECVDHCDASATDMVELSWLKFQNKEFEDVAYFEPFYLKEFMIGPK